MLLAWLTPWTWSWSQYGLKYWTSTELHIIRFHKIKLLQQFISVPSTDDLTWTHVHLYNVYKCHSYIIGNTVHLYHKTQLVNCSEKQFLSREPHGTYECTVWKTCTVFGDTLSNHCALKGRPPPGISHKPTTRTVINPLDFRTLHSAIIYEGAIKEIPP